jgi:hypothetical protein
MKRHHLAELRLKREGITRSYSQRPILRQVMKDRLRERLTHMLHEKLKW